MLLSEKRAELLKAYVEQGGILIIGARSGLKDMDGHCVMAPMPGLLKNVSGSDVREFTFVGPADDAVSMEWNGKEVETGLFNDILSAEKPEAKVLAVYGGSYYAGSPALVETAAGKGKVLHFGGTFTRENIREFLAYTGVLEPWADQVAVPADCEIAVREKDGRRYLMVLNFAWEPRTVTLKQEAVDLDDGKILQGDVVLPAFGTKVYQL